MWPLSIKKKEKKKDTQKNTTDFLLRKIKEASDQMKKPTWALKHYKSIILENSCYS